MRRCQTAPQPHLAHTRVQARGIDAGELPGQGVAAPQGCVAAKRPLNHTSPTRVYRLAASVQGVHKVRGRRCWVLTNTRRKMLRCGQKQSRRRASFAYRLPFHSHLRHRLDRNQSVSHHSSPTTTAQEWVLELGLMHRVALRGPIALASTPFPF